MGCPGIRPSDPFYTFGIPIGSGRKGENSSVPFSLLFYWEDARLFSAVKKKTV
jgi:hypothetical protein